LKHLTLTSPKLPELCNLFAEFQILKGLKYKADFGIDRLLEQKERSIELNSPGGYGTTILLFKTNM
jgi:hypothetical protein